MNNIDYAFVAEYCKKNYREMCDDCIKISDMICNNTFRFHMPWDMERTEEPTHFDGEINWFLQKNGDSEYLFQMSRMRYLINLAQAYWLTGNEKYVIAVKRLINDFIDRVPCRESSWVHPWRSLEVGLRGEYWTKAIALVQDSEIIDKTFTEKFRRSLNEHAQMLIKCHDLHKKLSNWGVIQDHGLFAIGIVLGNNDYIHTALNRLYEEAKLQIMADGAHWEKSSMYHNEVLFCLMDVMIRARAAGVLLDGDFIARVHSMARVNAAWMKPNHRQPLFGDSDYTDIRDVLSQSACIFNDGVLKSLGFPQLDYESAWLLGEDGINKYANIKPTLPDYTSISLCDSGDYIMRSDFSEDSNYLIFHNGYTGGGHAHEDKLSFELTVGGEDMLVDCGRYTYVWGEERKYLKSFRAHNTLSIDGRQFVKAHDWGFTRFAPHIKGEMKIHNDYELASGSHLGYFHSPLGSAVVTRKILWIKPDIYVIVDDISARGMHRYKQHFNFAPGGRLTLKNLEAVYINRESSIVLIPLKKGIKLRQNTGMYSDHYNAVETIDRAECSFTAFGETRAVTVIAANPHGKYNRILVNSSPLHGMAGRPLDQNTGECVTITLNDDTYTVMLLHKELCLAARAGEKYSAAKLAFYKNGQYHVVEW